jgi:hypothetical protein
MVAMAPTAAGHGAQREGEALHGGIEGAPEGGMEGGHAPLLSFVR